MWDERMPEKKGVLRGETSFVNLLPDEFEEVTLRDDVQLVDVRTETEFNEAHIPGAIVLDVLLPHFAVRAQECLDAQKGLAVYCKGGVRSRHAANQLLLMGFKVYNLDGGIEQWVAAGKPLAK